MKLITRHTIDHQLSPVSRDFSVARTIFRKIDVDLSAYLRIAAKAAHKIRHKSLKSMELEVGGDRINGVGVASENQGKSTRGRPLRKLSIYVEKYGPQIGPKLYQTLQSQAGHASVAARLRKKLAAIRERRSLPLPLFDGPPATLEPTLSAGVLNPCDALPLPPPWH